jgi:hypothetical protein
MKRINFYLLRTAFFLSVVAAASCSKKIDEAYQNPNSAVRVPIEGLLPQVITAMAGNYAGHGPANDIRYIGAFVQNWHSSVTLSNYDRMGHPSINTADVAASTWRSHYYDIGQNNMKIIEWGTEEKKWDYVGVAQAIFAWSWLTLTDYYGDVILNDAFNRDKITFSFSPQSEVYPFVRSLCFTALENLNKSGDGVSQQNLAKGDVSSYAGNTQKWKKFVYGVLARSHIHLSRKSGFRADSAVYYANLAMMSNDDNLYVLYPGGSLSAFNNFFGPFRANLASATTATPTAVRQGAYIADLMSGRNNAFLNVADPRAIYLLRLNTNNTFRGVAPNRGQAALAANDRPENFWGVPQVTANNVAPSNDNNSRYIFRNTSPFPVMTATEMAFIQAEAQIYANNKGAALTAYRQGIQLNFDMLTTTFNTNVPAANVITPAIRDAFLSNTAVVPANAATLTLSQVMLQKYIAMFGYGVLETWVDLRRYRYNGSSPLNGGIQVFTDFVVPTGNDLFEENNGNLVYRMKPRYNAEYVWNLNEIRRIGADLPDYHTREMWFMQP